MYRKFGKRTLDILFSGLGLLVFSPVYLIVSILVKATSPGPVIFKQERIGKGQKIFTIYKFRTMAENSEHTGSGVYSNDKDPRVTRVGRLLRRHSLDELPQLMNVLKGQMSFIGPRPPLTYHPWPISDYTQEQLGMFRVRPGLTGWAQVNGRRTVEWNERIRLNNWYIDHLSFGLDCKILWRTIHLVVSNDNNENRGATVPPPPKS